MKNHNLNITALILILAISITGQSFGKTNYDKADKKKVVKINMQAPLIKLISSTLNVSPEDLDILKEELKDVNFFLVDNGVVDLEVSMAEATEAESVFVIEYNNETPDLEDWMFEEDYLYTESTPEIEDWMFEEEYLNTEAVPVFEDWMFEEEYLSTEAVPVIEDWMFEEDYLSAEASPVIEDWMLDEDYLSSTESSPEFEDWMFNVDYYETEDKAIAE